MAIAEVMKVLACLACESDWRLMVLCVGMLWHVKSRVEMGFKVLLMLYNRLDMNEMWRVRYLWNVIFSVLTVWYSSSACNDMSCQVTGTWKGWRCGGEYCRYSWNSFQLSSSQPCWSNDGSWGKKWQGFIRFHQIWLIRLWGRWED